MCLKGGGRDAITPTTLAMSFGIHLPSTNPSTGGEFKV